MTQIMKENGKTIVKTGARIDTLNAAQFENDLQPAMEQGVDLEIDCSELTYMASSGLRILQSTMRTVVRSLGGHSLARWFRLYNYGLHGRSSAMVEHKIVDLAAAGSSPVSDPCQRL